MADALKAAKVPVLIGGTLRLPTEPTDPYDAPYANPARLHEAGVTFAIRSGGRGPEPGDRRAEPALRGRHRRRLRPARGRGPEGRHARPGADPGRRRPGRLARGRQAGQPRHHRRPHPPADDRGQGPVHRRQAAGAREPPHPALRQVPPPPRRGPGRHRPPGTRPEPPDRRRARPDRPTNPPLARRVRVDLVPSLTARGRRRHSPSILERPWQVAPRLLPRPPPTLLKPDCWATTLSFLVARGGIPSGHAGRSARSPG